MADQDEVAVGQALGSGQAAPGKPTDQYEMGRKIGATLHPAHAKRILKLLEGHREGEAQGDDDFDATTGGSGAAGSAALGGALGVSQGAGPTLFPKSGGGYGPQILGSPTSDPGPADADMQQIDNNAWQPQRAPAAAPAARVPQSHVDFSQANPSLGTQSVDVQKLRDIADQVENAPQKTNLSAVADYVDHIAGTNYAKNYQAPLNADQKAMEAAKLRSMAAGAQNNITRDQMQALIAQARNEGMLQRTLATAGNKTDAAAAKTTADLNKQFQKFGADSDATTQKRNTIGMIGQTGYRASHVAALIDRFQSGDKLSPIELQELGTATASMLSGGAGATAQAQIEEFSPPGIGKTAAEITGYLSDAPKDANMGAWVNRLGGTAHALGQQAETQMKNWSGGVADRYQNLFEADPDRFYRMMAHKGFSKAEVNQIFSQDNLDQQAASFKGLQTTDNTGGVYSSQIVPIANLKKFRLGGVPKDPPPTDTTPDAAARYQKASAKAKKTVWDAYSQTQPDELE